MTWVDGGNLGLHIRVQVGQIGQLGLVQLAQQTPVHLQTGKRGRGNHDVIPGLARHQLGVNNFIVVVGVVADLDACLFFKISDRIVCNVVRPVVDVEDFFLLGGGAGGHTHRQADGSRTLEQLTHPTDIQ